MTYEFHPAAEQEYADAALWYENQVEGLGSRFAAAISEAIGTILKEPGRFQCLGDGLRVFRLNRWPYKLYYEFQEAKGHVRIVCVMHQKRRPEYWMARMGR
ncbi:type II toxin-antitoxin system RelE/ParE family toxin [Luteolibacter arcticus]|uniref:Type II toxin-antitoxin system RelE/ParE family toxin n=1 Tax=Luteolibacter arcticus TaxID=1581411 RepID=A0ABT3GQ79_9BACT|nr:type II toxin-antitoxin system RelE/ParE family toxin [Luteolibacter arcticus]MCW1925631.1 type II toxin-antitoxin system RelE/ParE family toxin [Luteolibacter arcticus]